LRSEFSIGAATLHYPLSHCQEPFWLQEAMGRGSANIAPLLLTCDELEPVRLEAAFHAVVRRHEALRTAIVDSGNGPVGVVAPECTPSLQIARAEAAGPLAREEVLRALCEPFDLGAAPLCRGLAHRQHDGRWLVGFAFHHLIFDGWSASLFIRELSLAYRRAREPAPAPPYSAFSAAARGRLHARRRAQLQEFWQRELDGVEAPAQFAMRPQPGSACGPRPSLEWSAEEVALLQKLARDLRVTPFVVFLCATAVLLNRHTGREDLVIGSPVALRSEQRFMDTIGCFVGTLPLRLQLTGSTGFAELAAKARAKTWRALAHADAPLTEIVQWSGAVRRPDANPLFSVLLNFLSFPQTEIDSPFRIGADAMLMPVPRFPLTLYASWKSTYALHPVFDGGALDASYVAALLGQFRAVVRAAAHQPSLRIGDIRLEPERRNALAVARRAAPFPTVPELILRHAERHPTRPAIEKGAAAYGYGELVRKARAVAAALRARGAAPGAAVAVIGGRSFETVAGALAVWLAGGVLLLLDRELPALRMASMCADAGARHLVATEPQPALPPDLSAAREVIYSAGIPPAGAAAADEPALASGDAYLFYTSGTTGTPRGVLGTHLGLSHFVHWQRAAFEIGERDRVAAITGLSFDVVLRELFLPLASGATLVLPPDSSANVTDPSWLCGSGATVLHVVPTVARAMLPALAASGGLPALRWTFFAGEALHDTLAADWRGVAPNGRIVNLYGPTETTLAKCAYLLPQEPIGGVQPIGYALDGADVVVVDPGLRPCAMGEAGEIAIRTPYRSRGYHGDPSCGGRFVRNPHTADPDDWIYRSGDLGRTRPEGCTEILGRRDLQLKLNGVRIEPEEVAAAIRRHPAARDAAVLVDTDGGKPCLAAYVQLAPGQRLSVEELAAFLRARLLPAMVPADIVFVERMPTTLNGKLDASVLRHQRAAARPACVLPRGELEQRLAALWRKRLGRRPFGVLDNFFDAGGSSLDLMAIMPELSAILGRRLSAADILQNLTIASLAALHEVPATAAPRPPDRGGIRRDARGLLRARAARRRGR
jgi:amino acid adenylation domain-containing protein